MSKTVVVLESFQTPDSYWNAIKEQFGHRAYATQYLHESSVFNSPLPKPKEPVKIVQLLIPD